MKKSKQKLTQKALICAFLAVFAISLSHAQTTADFTFDSVCVGSLTTLNENCTSTYPILEIRWSLGNDSIFDDSIGISSFSQYFYVDTWIGIKVITTNDSDSIFKHLTIFQYPVPYFQVTDSVQCLNTNNFKFKGETTYLGAGTVSQFWRFGDGITSSLDTVFHSYTTSGYKTAWLIASSDIGCKDSMSQNVNVRPVPVADFNIPDTTKCPLPEIFQFQNQSSITPSASLTYYWTFGDGANGYSLSDTTHGYASVGNYNVQLLATSPDGCKDSIIKMVYVSTAIVPDFNINNSTQCMKGNNFIFTNTSNICTPIDNIKWDLDNDGNANDFNGSPANKVFTASGTYNIKMVIYSGVLKDSITKVITVNPSPTVDFSINDSIQDLAGNSFIFTDNSTLVPAGPMTRLWNAGDGNTSALSPYTHSYSAPNIYKVKLKVTAGSCTDSLIKNVYVYIGTAANFTAPTVCFGDSTLFTNTTVNPYTHLYWALDNDSVFNDKTDVPTFKYKYPAPGTYSVGLKVMTLVDTNTIFKNVTVLPSPNAGFTINSISQNLAGNNFIVNDTSNITPPMALTTFWDFDDGFTSTNASENHSYTAMGNYDIKLVSTASNNCKDSMITTVNVFIAGLLYPDFTFDTVCFGTPTTLTSTTIHSDPIITYNWALDPDSLFNDHPGDSIVMYTFPTAGLNIVGLEVITATDTQFRFIPVVVYYSPVADFTVNQDTQIIYSNNYQFTNTSTLNPPDTFGSYWEYGDGGSTYAKNPNYIYLTPGTFGVKLVVTSGNGCKDSIIKDIHVLPVVTTVDFNVFSRCYGDTTIFQNLTTIMNDTVLMYLWDFGDSYGSNDTNTKHRYDSAKTYFVKLIVLTKHGFKDSIIKTVPITPHPSMNLTYSGLYYFFNGDTVCIYETYNLTATISGLYDSILWSTGSTANNITVDTNGTYSVYVADTNGCSNDTFFILRVVARKPMQFRNVITPNDDGFNDLWRILNLEMYIPAEITIFDRWGMEVFSSSDYKNDWNGEYKGDKLPQGTYYYVIKTHDGKILKGSVNILR